MDLPTQTHLTTLRELLVYRLRELRADVDAAELEQRESATASEHEVADQKDEATAKQRMDIDGAQERRDLREMADVEAALRRLDEGVYGDCADCGQPIPLARLMVQPAAMRCAACQTQRERITSPRRAPVAPEPPEPLLP